MLNQPIKFIRSIGLVAVLLSICFFTESCRKDFTSLPSDGHLQFSMDTVVLDTVFSTIGSSTYKVTVYNHSHHNITIPSVRLEKGQSSHYRLNVDGRPGKVFKNVAILAQDSIFIFIETTVDLQDFAQNTDQFLYTDEILFDVGVNQQNIALVTLIQDAHFLYPQKFNNGSTEKLIIGHDQDGNPIRVSGFYLDKSELHFTDIKPYVIYGYAAVPPHQTLVIDAGARVYFHAEGGLIVANQASLHVNGMPSNNPKTLENEVIFQGDRLEPEYENVPGQWQTIWLTKGSRNNIINHATIKNATVGIRIDAHTGGSTPMLKINNSQIYNCATVGLWAATSYISGENLVINNCGQAALYLSLGGTYNFYNSTFVNYWQRGYRNYPAVLIANRYETSEKVFVADLKAANFYNCIIYGNKHTELLFGKSEKASFNYKFENCLIRFKDAGNSLAHTALYNFEDKAHYKNNVFNQNPDFLNPEANKLNISHSSAANGLANPLTASSTDILNTPRGRNPDSGAYESTVFKTKQ